MHLNKIRVLIALAALSAATALAAPEDRGDATRADPTLDPVFAIEKPTFEAISSSAARGKLKRAWRAYRVGARQYRIARTQKSHTKAARFYESAAARFDFALRTVKRLRTRDRQPALVTAASRLEAHASLAARASYLELADAYTSRGSYKQALDAANQAIRIDPRDRRARQLRGRVQLAQAAAGRR